jgi:site-specific DNA-methyltransferase (adenine-specific)
MSDLYLGDCLDVMKTFPDNEIDLILVDLPYQLVACSWDSMIPLEPLWEQYNRITKENAAMVFTASQPFTTILISSNIKIFRYEWIWEKPQGTNPMAAKIMPLKSHENILVFYRKSPTYNPQMWYSDPYSGFKSSTKKIGEAYGDLKSQHRDNPDGSRYPKTVLQFKQEKGFHPTQKPVPLMEYLIKTYSNEGETVLDNTMGSGTTGVAAIQCDRKFIGIESDVGYYDIAVKRIRQAEKEKKMSLDRFFT